MLWPGDTPCTCSTVGLVRSRFWRFTSFLLQPCGRCQRTRDNSPVLGLVWSEFARNHKTSPFFRLCQSHTLSNSVTYSLVIFAPRCSFFALLPNTLRAPSACGGACHDSSFRQRRALTRYPQAFVRVEAVLPVRTTGAGLLVALVSPPRPQLGLSFRCCC